MKVSVLNSRPIIQACTLGAMVLTLSACGTQHASPATQSGSRLVYNGAHKNKHFSFWHKQNNDHWNEIIARLQQNKPFKSAKVDITPVQDGSLRISATVDDLLKRNNKNLTSNAQSILKSIGKELDQDQSLRLKIVGHTDDTGSDMQNQLISLSRANTLAQYLIKQGVNSMRIDVEGRGSIDPMLPNNSRKNRNLNRRVELYIYQLDE
ncbi:OmpA family protein [Brackiella oedipodis]|uniref:OmpA family protein n=1 Tax=Brackiella oedipodis TaxID=124225 RepID=UPI000685536D|nr:OmpA family protein [Brackiella oedipodis]